MKPSHTGTPSWVAAASPITAPDVGKSQKYGYGTALVAHHDGLFDTSFTVLCARRCR
jgi:hypothetical protein